MLYGILLLFPVDALLFHTGIYRKYLDPFSMAGWMSTMVWACQFKVIDNTIAVIGDSRVADGFSAKIANESGKPGEIKFSNIAVHGTSPRVWYYQLREIDPKANRFSTLAIMMPNYDDSGEGDLADRPRDINYLVPYLHYSDVFTFVGSFTSSESKMHAAICNILNGVGFKIDLLEFLANPKKRLDLVKLQHYVWRTSNYNYAGHPETLKGLAPDPKEPGGLRFPADTTPEHKLHLQGYFNQITTSRPQDFVARYHTYWLGKILDRYRGSRTKIIVFEMPRGPLHYLKPQAPPNATLLNLQVKYGFTILPPEAFGDCERPEFFSDFLHLNSVGRQRFSAEFAPVLRRVAGASLSATR